jgi:hypothetical protein
MIVVVVMMVVVIVAHGERLSESVPACRGFVAAQSSHVFVTPFVR